jgi:EAL domain-containing protein (putative c-di-GMP-specific phosphodiesterase class I)
MTSSKVLFPYFQPIICTASGGIVGYEALARQYDEEGRVISAGNLFISHNIDDKQLILWDRNVRRQALQKFSQLKHKGYLTINISASWIDYVDDFTALPTLSMLQELNIDKSRIIIEITESKVALEKLIRVVKEYRKHGLKVAIDDFGTGYSQLERVMEIRPDIIKLDMKLFKQAARGGIEQDVVHLITALSKRRACQIVCEGVETEEEFFYAVDCGAQFMQGYLFSAAESEFQVPNRYQQKIELLRNKFLQKTMKKESDKNAFMTKIKSLVHILRTALESDFNLNKLLAYPFEQSGVLRFYLCDNQGNQISSNFNFSDGKWFEEYREVGFNWSWRPYFYHLLALQPDDDDKNQLVTSERYRDFNTGLLCKTLSLRLDEERILMIDVIAELA